MAVNGGIFGTLKEKLRQMMGDTPTSSDKMFVYGTLMNLKEVKEMWAVEPDKIEKATMWGNLYSDDQQPIMLDGKGTVHGLLLTIPSLTQDPSVFDRYEACHNNSPVSFHLRVLKEATASSGEKSMAWVYVGNPKHGRVKRICVVGNLIIQGHWKSETNRLHGPLE